MTSITEFKGVNGTFSNYLSKNGRDMFSTFFEKVCIISLFLSFKQLFKTQNLFFSKHSSWKIKFLFDIICLICLRREVSEMGLRFF